MSKDLEDRMQHPCLQPLLPQVQLSHLELPHLEHLLLPHLLHRNGYLLLLLRVELQAVTQSNENRLLRQLREIQLFLLPLLMFRLPLREETYHLRLLLQLCEATFLPLPRHLQREELFHHRLLPLPLEVHQAHLRRHLLLLVDQVLLLPLLLLLRQCRFQQVKTVDRIFSQVFKVQELEVSKRRTKPRSKPIDLWSLWELSVELLLEVQLLRWLRHPEEVETTREEEGILRARWRLL